MKKNEITEEDVNMIKYFWEAKGDISKWVSFEERLSVIRKHYPEVIHAWEQMKIYKKLLDAAVDNMLYPDDDDY